MADNYLAKTAHSSGKHNSSTALNGLRDSPFEIIQPKSTILLQSKGGLSLPTEICLKIVEDVMTVDPKVGSWALMTVSKDFYTLLRTYQQSIVKTVSTNEGTNDRYPTTLLPSWPRYTGTPIFARSYPWLCEVRCRTHTIESLVNHTITDMRSSASRTAIDLPAPDVPKAELFKRTERFKREALHLLYGLSDSTATSDDMHVARAHQRFFLESLTTTELAILGSFVRVLGIGYFRLTKSKHPDKTSDSIRDRWIVFEDRVLRFGPFFAYATTVVATERTIRDWSDEVIAQALKDMEEFETGKFEGYASLQSVLWKLFCARAGYGLFDSWEEAKERVEQEMGTYDV